jgi:uncharacterized membrane protein YbaN (DUF454 family)
MSAMIKQTKRTAVFILAIICVLIGLVGVVLPLIPGVLFFALALVIFSLFFPVIGEKMHYHTRNYPKLQQTIVRMRAWVENTIGEL